MKQSDRLRKLILANKTLAKVDSLDDLFPRLLELAQDVADAQASSLMLYDPQSGLLEFAQARNDLDPDIVDSLREVRLSLGEGIAGWVAQRRRSVIISDAARDSRFHHQVDDLTGYTTRSLICAPVTQGEELLGVIQVLNPAHGDFTEEDLVVLESFADLASVALVRSRLLEVKLEQERFRIQLEAAARIQRHFLPPQPDFGPGARFWAETSPAAFVGGDLYDCIPMPNGTYIAYVTDVSGKGLPAALIMAALWARIRGFAPTSPSLGRLLARVNDSLFDFLTRDALFATVAICSFSPEDGGLEIASAGHPASLLVGTGRTGRVESIDGLQGMPLGIARASEYETTRRVLERGESFVMMSDGVVEALNIDRELFGEERAERTLAGATATPRGADLSRAVSAWRSGTSPNDDTTILEIWRTDDES
jgi:serine phosphatase RsbU (regulator of sigma subunit)